MLSLVQQQTKAVAAFRRERTEGHMTRMTSFSSFFSFFLFPPRVFPFLFTRCVADKTGREILNVVEVGAQSASCREVINVRCKAGEKARNIRSSHRYTAGPRQSEINARSEKGHRRGNKMPQICVWCWIMTFLGLKKIYIKNNARYLMSYGALRHGQAWKAKPTKRDAFASQ